MFMTTDVSSQFSPRAEDYVMIRVNLLRRLVNLTAYMSAFKR